MNCTATFVQGTTPQTLRVDIQGGSSTGIVTAFVNNTPAGISCSSAAGSDCTEDYMPGTAVVLTSNLANTAFVGCDDVISDQLGFNYCHVGMDDGDRFVLVAFPN